MDQGESVVKMSLRLTLLALGRTLLQIIAGCFIEVGTSFIVDELQFFPWASIVVFVIAAIIIFVLNKKRYPNLSLDNDLKLVPYIVSLVIIAFIDNFSAAKVVELIESVANGWRILIYIAALLKGAVLLAVDYLCLDPQYERNRIDLFDNVENVNKQIEDFQKSQKKTYFVVVIIIVLVFLVITLLHYFNRIELWKLYRSLF